MGRYVVIQAFCTQLSLYSVDNFEFLKPTFFSQIVNVLQDGAPPTQ